MRGEERREVSEGETERRRSGIKNIKGVCVRAPSAAVMASEARKVFLSRWALRTASARFTSSFAFSVFDAFDWMKPRIG